MQRRPQKPFTAAPDTNEEPPQVPPKTAVAAPETLVRLVRLLARNAAALEQSKVKVHIDCAAGAGHPCNSNAV